MATDNKNQENNKKNSRHKMILAMSVVYGQSPRAEDRRRTIMAFRRQDEIILWFMPICRPVALHSDQNKLAVIYNGKLQLATQCSGVICFFSCRVIDVWNSLTDFAS